MKRFVLRLLLGLAIFAALVVALNFDYFRKQAELAFRGAPPLPENSGNFPQGEGEPNLLVIQSLGITAPIQYVDADPRSLTPKALEDIFQEALIEGVVHYPGTVLPGGEGNSYIFGHSSDNAWSKGKFKTIFATLPSVEIGAEVRITDREGDQFIYVVTESKRVSKDALEYLSPVAADAAGRPVKRLTLQTSYPVGTSLARWIVIAEIVDSSQ